MEEKILSGKSKEGEILLLLSIFLYIPEENGIDRI